MSTVVIDSSALVAILNQEPDADHLSSMIRKRAQRVMSAATYPECAIVASRWEAGRSRLDEWLAREATTVMPIDHALARIAADAFAR